MNKKLVTAGVILVILGIIIAGVMLSSKNQTGGSYVPIDNTPATSTSTDTSATSSSTTADSYTSAIVATHNSKASCWTSINGNVYDVTTWISQHPGGQQAILSLCGKDGTAAFTTQHGGQGRPEAELASFKIGMLAK